MTAAPDVATVEAQFADGTRVTTTVSGPPAGGYGGAYRGKARFYGFSAATSSPLVRARLRDAAGKVIQVQDVEAPPPAVGTATRITGAPPLFLAVVPARRLARQERVFCVGLQRPRTLRDCAGFGFPRAGFDVSVDCATRTTVFVGRVSPRTVGIDLVLAGGERRPVKIRAGRVVGARLPSGEALQTVIVRAGRASRRLRYFLPPAARQCGYSAFPGS